MGSRIDEPAEKVGELVFKVSKKMAKIAGWSALGLVALGLFIIGRVVNALLY